MNIILKMAGLSLREVPVQKNTYSVSYTHLVVCLTGQEACLMKKITEGRRQLEERLLKNFSAGEAEALRDYLKRLYENIKEE